MTSKQEDTQRPTTSRIPDFRTREEEAAFWDTHDFTDYLDESWPVRLRRTKNLTRGLTVRLEPQDREQLGELARKQGIGPSTLVRMWIKERLRQT
ncbi:MAG: hypothetical protein H0W06_06160 [Chloroflexia bacterium]|nr:hypothetical protein [Chloroflexia bacterium]